MVCVCTVLGRVQQNMQDEIFVMAAVDATDPAPLLSRTPGAPGTRGHASPLLFSSSFFLLLLDSLSSSLQQRTHGVPAGPPIARVGEHTAAILRGLGWTAAQCEAAAAAGVVKGVPVPKARL
jgi:hypothetical protein